MRGLREGSIAWQAEQRRKAVLGAVERLRSCGVVEATADEVGREAGLSKIAAGKLLRSAGFERVERNRRAGERAVWVLEQDLPQGLAISAAGGITRRTPVRRS